MPPPTSLPWRIACVRLPHFPLAVAVRDHPEVLGQPIALISETEQVARVEAVSRAAAERGVAVGQTAARARARCPDLCCLPWVVHRLAEAAREVAQRLEAASPLVVPVPEEPGCFWLDARGMRYLGGEPGLLARARSILEAAGYTQIRLGLADTASAARAMARHPHPPDPPIVPPGGDAAFLGHLPLEALDLQSDLRTVLHQLGVTSVAALRDLPPGSLESRFGPAGREAVDRALARDPRRPDGAPPPALPEVVWALETPVDVSGPLIFGLRHLLDTLAARLVEQARSATRVALVFALDDGGSRTEVLEPVRPLHHPAALFELLRERLERLTFDSPVVELRVEVRDAQPAAAEQVHLDAAQFDPVALEGALNRLQGRFGEAVVMVPRGRDDHRPEAAGFWEAVTEAPVQPASPAAGPPRDPSVMHRTLPAPRPLAVRTDHEGRPIAIERQGRWHAVVAYGPERMSGHWWEAEPYSREDWRVALDGEVLWIAREAAGWTLRGWWD